MDEDRIQVVRGTHVTPNNGRPSEMPRPVVAWATERGTPEWAQPGQRMRSQVSTSISTLRPMRTRGARMPTAVRSRDPVARTRRQPSGWSSAGPVTVSGKAMSDLRHGWAITVHRAQGSEWPGVVVVVPPEAGGMLSRPLIYTALTRAQSHLSIVHASGSALARAVREVDVRPRRTRLARLLTETAG